MENQADHQRLLQKYISGQSTPEETSRVLEWLATPEGARALKNNMHVAGKEAFGDVPDLPRNISAEIYSRLKQQLPGPRTARLPLPIKWLAAALAGMLLLGGGGYLLSTYHRLTYATGIAQKEVIVLPDHSTVTLRGDSRLRVLGNWEKAALRKVYLEGEAFFDVVSNEAKPFVVTTSDIGIKVLGTSFNVKSYADEGTIETTLVSGKVVIEAPGSTSGGEQLVLRPNQKATYTKASSSIVLDEVDTRLYTSWKSGMLIFEDAPFTEIARELERRYGVEIQLKDAAAGKCRFTMKVSDEPLLEVLDLFSSTTAASYAVDGDQVIIEGKLCP